MPFPANPSMGDAHYVGNIRYIYNSGLKTWSRTDGDYVTQMTLAGMTGNGIQPGKEGGYFVLLHDMANYMKYRFIITAYKDGSHYQTIDCYVNSHYDTIEILTQQVETRGNYLPIKKLYAGFLANSYSLVAVADFGSDRVDVKIQSRVIGSADDRRVTVQPRGAQPDAQITFPGTVYNWNYVGIEYNQPWQNPWGMVYQSNYSAGVAVGDNVWSGYHWIDHQMIPGRLIRYRVRFLERALSNYDGGNGMIHSEYFIKGTSSANAASWDFSFMLADTYDAEYFVFGPFDFTLGLGQEQDSHIKRIQSRIRLHGKRIANGQFFAEIEDLGPNNE